MKETPEAVPGKLVMLPIESLYPHPDNPRKDVGDVTELAESIKANGILQNLTVVPGHTMTTEEWRVIHGRHAKNPTEKDRQLMKSRYLSFGYTVIIGHRRLAAAKMAGLAEVPCAVVEMTEKDQLSTMLTENMQRVDLTVLEQAQGFQMMLDLGDDLEEIAKKSGFTKATVRKRLEIAKLDKKILQRVSGRQLTIGDFDELAKVEDLTVRNKILGTMGTSNFKNELQQALRNQRAAKRMEEWLAVIRNFATEDPKASYQTRKYIGNYGYWNLDKEVVEPKDAGSANYYYRIGIRGDQIDLYTDRDEAAEKASQEEAAAKRRKEEQRELRYQDINDRHWGLRCDFLKNLTAEDCRKNRYSIFRYVADTLYRSDGYDMDLDLVGYLLGIKIEKKAVEETNRLSEVPGIRSAIEAFPEKTMLCLAVATMEDGKEGYWWRRWDCGGYAYEHKENPRLDEYYAVLESLGYALSDEEKAMQTGDHPVFLSGGDSEEM